MSKEIFIMTFEPRKTGTKAYGFSALWLIIAGHLEETFHEPNIVGSHPI
jgi:hypothetical protein